MHTAHGSQFERRQFLQAGTAALLGTLADARLSRGASTSSAAPRSTDAGHTGRARNCILVYLLGGPPHLDMWDMKPAAPVEVRGPFSPIATSVPGLEYCEHLPRLAQQAHRSTLLRSLSYPNSDHPYMIYHTLTGRISAEPLGANTVLQPSRTDDPHLGAVISKFKHADPRVPGYVAIPEVRVRMGPSPVSGGGRAGFLGPRFDPLAINDDVRESLPLLNPPEGVSATRLGARDSLLAVLDGRSARSSRIREYVTARQTAMQLARTSGDGGLLDLAAEPDALRERYGRQRFGQTLLLARRLVERGVSFVGVHFNYMTQCDGWDTHKQNFAALKDELLPLLDQGLSALFDDLADRGLLDETLVVTMGEFGRTPKINNDAGRDHWGPCGSVLFAGGGVRAGQIVGRSDAVGAYPVSDPVAPADVVASIYHALGVDPEQIMHDALRRPIPLSTGRVIRDLF